jgi:hypothetical protein
MYLITKLPLVFLLKYLRTDAKMKIAILGSRGYPNVYSGYEIFVEENSECLALKNIDVTVYCHKNLINSFPAQINGINLIYIPTIERKSLSEFVHT